MHLAHSALRTKQKNGKSQLANKELDERYRAYLTACNKYQAEIAAIQKYMPGWLPPFKLKA
ncbi:hypothetical protein [Mucilaginibacter phyllosphaerae]|uniref:Uncharacterized protein n=1 Tax=Mucilaginibacter phyllosphaerae TaxID=1812349 RepID=A0A4Y8AL68_9SPHI|nr:hypothetical protein [Mucilaginibacter phyllosphaerae]MBB3967757.1 hypothetical protein [Mucilaginibacter phyllosphaerae]TEW69195.1 hypothetical protein E2R65_03240 [Mucilaginibacter phyllosphaerae]GGH03527.1 hypothetical protein GCM10007352_06260 [Mucilaginibacter phyllosphaerae]